MIATLTNALFGCVHENRCWPRKDRRGEYQRCLDCGARISYDFASLGAVKVKPETFCMEAEFGESR
jgi:hypothetical protein